MLLRWILILASVPVFAGDSSFDDFVRRLESHYGTKRLHIPFFGIVSFASKITRPAGAGDLKLAVFEHVSGRHPSNDELNSMLSSLKSQGWSPFVRVSSRREQTYIYVRPVSREHEMLITTFEDDEAVVVRVRLNADRLSRWVKKPVLMGRCRFTSRERGGE